MVMSVRDTTIIMNNKKKEDEKIDEINLFHELIQKTYLKTIDLMRKVMMIKQAGRQIARRSTDHRQRKITKCLRTKEKICSIDHFT